MMSSRTSQVRDFYFNPHESEFCSGIIHGVIVSCRKKRFMIFLTGGTGFLGRHLLHALMKQGMPVRALKRSGSIIPESNDWPGTVEWVEGNILDITSLTEHMKGCTTVYHCAGLVSFRSSDKRNLIKVNVEGTANVVNAALDCSIGKLVYASSVAAIGRPSGSRMINESSEWDSRGHHTNYGISKYLAEREVWRGIAEGLQAVIVNPSIIIGEGNWLKGSPRFFLNSWKGMPFYAEGTTGFVAAKDVVALMLLMGENHISGERFIINAENLAIKDFLCLLADTLHRKKPSIRVRGPFARLLAFAEALRSVFTQDEPMITAETARIAAASSYFEASKVIAATGYEFMPIKDCIEQTGRKFLSDMAQGKIKS